MTQNFKDNKEYINLPDAKSLYLIHYGMIYVNVLPPNRQGKRLQCVTPSCHSGKDDQKNRKLTGYGIMPTVHRRIPKSHRGKISINSCAQHAYRNAFIRRK